MSRTDKDRPWRIKALDASEPRKAYHNHELIGKTYLRYIWAGKSERVLVEYGEPIWILRDKHGTPGMTLDEYLNHQPRYERLRYEYGLAILPCQSHMRWYYERRARFEYTNRSTVEVSMADHCTVDEPDTWANPCGYWTRYRNERVGDSTTHLINLYHRRPERQRERKGMKNLQDEYNTFGEVDDSTWQDYPIRRTWWD